MKENSGIQIITEEMECTVPHLTEKYFLIVSQYRHSYYSFICVRISNLEKYKKLLIETVAELEKYKRKGNDNREIHLGDIEYLINSDNELMYRCNINDDGDIYIINHDSIDRLKEEAVHYEIEGYKHSRYITVNVMTDISNHHSYKEVRRIIEKRFIVA